MTTKVQQDKLVRSAAAALLMVSADEAALLEAYRRSSPDHQQQIRMFAYAAADRDAAQDLSNVVAFIKTDR